MERHDPFSLGNQGSGDVHLPGDLERSLLLELFVTDPIVFAERSLPTIDSSSTFASSAILGHPL